MEMGESRGMGKRKGREILRARKTMKERKVMWKMSDLRAERGCDCEEEGKGEGRDMVRGVCDGVVFRG